MEQGHWFLSLYNDDGDPQEITFIAMVAEEMTHNCPNGCSSKGECLMGHCQCQPGFGGDDCSKSKKYFFNLNFKKIMIFEFTILLSSCNNFFNKRLEPW